MEATACGEAVRPRSSFDCRVGFCGGRRIGLSGDGAQAVEGEDGKSFAKAQTIEFDCRQWCG